MRRRRRACRITGAMYNDICIVCVCGRETSTLATGFVFACILYSCTQPIPLTRTHTHSLRVLDEQPECLQISRTRDRVRVHVL